MNESEKINEARKKLKEKFGNVQKVGGMKRKHKAEHKAQAGDDKKVKEVVKKLSAQPLPDISDVNLFTDDNKVIQFKGGEVFGSFQNQTIIVSGKPETNDIKDCFADIVTQLSPEQLKNMKGQFVGEAGGAEKKEQPELVNFEEEAKKA